MAIIQVENRLRDLISNSGMTYEKLVGISTEVVIFGSRAAGLQRPDSDLDVLLIGTKIERPRVSGVDFVILDLEQLASPHWMGSELASHVAEYGKWIKGRGSWQNHVHVSHRATMRKQARVLGLLMSGPKWWSKLHPMFHNKYKLMIRRELQRLDLMRQKIAVPPTFTLDSDWERASKTKNDLIDVAATLPLSPLAFELAVSCIHSPNNSLREMS